MNESTRFRCAASVLALSIAIPGQAWAQDAKQAPAADTQQQDGASVQDIIVTGSRLKTAGFDAPTPVSVITEVEIQRAAPATISDFVNQMPALSGSRTPRTTRGSISDGLAGGNFLNLRNLGLPRTLVLMNGKRVTPATLTGAADVNTLPSPLIKRVDVVTGGASAAWGSDAVAGVVNFVLDKEYEGIKGSVQGGITTLGDAGSNSMDLSFGKSFADGKGHILLSGQYSKTRQALYRDRKWFNASKLIPNPQANGTAAQPTYLAAPWSSILANDTGLVATGPLKGYYFDANGQLGGTNFPLGSVNSNYAYGSEATYNRLYDQAQNSQATTPMEQKSLYGRLSYELSDAISVYAEGTYARSSSSAKVASYQRTGSPVNVAIDNYYLPDDVRAAMVTAGITTLPVNIATANMGVIDNHISRENIRGLGGVEGEFGNGWKWDVSYQFGRVNSKIRAENMPIPGHYNLAVDAIADPNNPGQVICRSSLTAPTNGCVPMNPLGSQALSAEQLAYVTGTSAQDIRYTQQVASANIAGDILTLPAGPLSFAGGVEYRSEKAIAEADPISQASQFWAGNFKNFTGKYNVKEVYGEIGVPLLKDAPFARSLSLNLAGRLTDYSTSGSVVTWKAGGRYEPIDGLEFRVTRSRDIRAPNLQELFQPGLLTNQEVLDPQNGNTRVRLVQTLSGNASLKPEKADTLTAGIVLRPAFAPGLRASVDYYDIKINDAITTNSAQTTINRCHDGLTEYCSGITRDGNGMLTAITLFPFNALEEQARGVDIEVSYTMPVGSGSLDMRVMANYVDKLDIVTPNAVIHRAGEVGNNTGAAEGVPSWRAVATVTYDRDPVTLQLKGRFISASRVDDAWGPTVLDKYKVPAIFYLDAYLGFKAGSIAPGGEFFLAADNILNKAPPTVVFSDNANSVSSGTNVYVYDVLGTSLRAGFRFQF
ncbi:TonB-dependent receptor (plasmid) [Novosphingobium resinovorum]|uniref:TonB-dependent receptor plug domain-containing protein n=1 Tax=Novosphingobium TaxID=165696 RepID=UPI001B3C9C51|nr:MULTISPECIES: TonB-dependent receptor [Novosphingobium]MBF7015250.1 TonB-dependent receptor [Novosphingobium sp. HR1a]WJM29925.1 TonB-dependent receptor [Novosphingobium resinovorum]